MKIITVLILGFLSGLFFSNTLKAQNGIDRDADNINEEITIRSIKNWLYQTAEKDSGSKKKFIQQIASNLSDNDLSVCIFNSRSASSGKLITIPLAGNTFSSIIPKDSVADQIFEIRKSKNGFSGAKLILISPKNKMHNSIQISCNDIKKIYHSNYFPIDGIVQVVNLGDTLIREYKYENHVMVEESFLEPEEIITFSADRKKLKGKMYFWKTINYLPGSKIMECKVEKYTIY